MAYQDFDFMGFTYNGKHSYRDFGIYRTSDGDRYEESLIPTLQEKTAQVPGMVGSYYFGVDVQNKQFNISFAFDYMTEETLRLFKQTFNGDGIHDLIFDEHPYKIYSAKVTGSATIKHICFELEEGRVYRGEGNIQFTCYYPYAHTPNNSKILGNGTKSAATVPATYIENATKTEYVHQQPEKQVLPCGVLIENTGWAFYVPVTSTRYPLINEIRINYYVNGKKKQVKNSYVSTTRASNFTPTFGGTGAVYVESIEYIFKRSIRKTNMTSSELTKNLDCSITNGTTTYKHSKTGSNEDYCYRNITKTYTGKCVNDYASYYYPSKREWYVTSEMPLHTDPTTNIGDLPATFKVSYAPGASDTDVTFTVGGASATVTGITANQYSDMTWDSKLGIVSAKINNAGDPKAIPCTGSPYTSIPVGGSTVVSKSAGTGSLSIEYDLWYY